MRMRNLTHKRTHKLAWEKSAARCCRPRHTRGDHRRVARSLAGRFGIGKPPEAPRIAGQHVPSCYLASREFWQNALGGTVEVLCGRGSTSLTSQQQSCQTVPSSSRCRSSGLSLDVPDISVFLTSNGSATGPQTFSVESERRGTSFSSCAVVERLHA